jgi:hypothetical protein
LCNDVGRRRKQRQGLLFLQYRRNSVNADVIPAMFYWKSTVSKLVGEVSLTGFLFVFARKRAF